MDYEIGKVYYGVEVGRIGKHIFDPCSKCGKPRLIRMSRQGGLCVSCAAKKSHKYNPRPNMHNSPQWKGGRTVDKNGYVLLYIPKTDPYYPMARAKQKRGRGGHVMEHRYIMAKHLGRLLKSSELVHHINGIKSDNRIDNLNLLDAKRHPTTYQEGYSDGYAKGYEKGFEQALINYGI